MSGGGRDSFGEGRGNNKLPPPKTLWCKRAATGCPFGDRCNFAHTREELERGLEQERRRQENERAMQQRQQQPQINNMQSGRSFQQNLQSGSSSRQNSQNRGNSQYDRPDPYPSNVQRGIGSSSGGGSSRQTVSRPPSRGGSYSQADIGLPRGAGQRTTPDSFSFGSYSEGSLPRRPWETYSGTSGSSTPPMPLNTEQGDPRRQTPQHTPSSRSRPSTSGGPSTLENLMDPSDVLGDGDPPSHDNDPPELSLLEFVKYRCQNVLRINEENNPEYEATRKKMEEDLKIYLEYDRGLKALLPSRRDVTTELPKCDYDIFANHFKIDLPPQLECRVYKIVWTFRNEIQPQPGKTFEQDRNKSWWEGIVRENGMEPTGLNNIQVVYDNRSTMVSCERFAWTDDQLRDGVTLRSDNLNVTVTIKLSNIVNLDEFRSFVLNNNPRSTFPKELVLVMNMVLKQYCETKGYIKSGDYYFDKDDRESLDNQGGGYRRPPPDILIAKSGYFQSVRVLGGGLTLNVDVMKAAFYKPGLVLGEVWLKIQEFYLSEEEKRSFSRGFPRDWTEEQARIATKCWKKLSIKSTHKVGGPTRDAEFTIYKVTSTKANKTIVTGKYPFQGRRSGQQYQIGNHPTTFTGNLITFMEERYNQDHRESSGHLPAIKLSKKEEFYLPWVCCETTDASRYGGRIEQFDGKLLSKLNRTPQQRHDDVERWMVARSGGPNPRLPTDNRPWAERLFNVFVSRQMMRVEGLVLPVPQVLVNAPDGGGQDREVILIHEQRRSTFRMRPECRFLKPVRDIRCIVMMFDPSSDRWTRAFLKKLAELGPYRGVNFHINNEFFWHNPGNGSYDQRRQLMKDSLGQKMEQNPNVELILCIMPKKLTPEYAMLKSECDRRHGVLTQVVICGFPKESDTIRGLPQLVENVLMKINVKCGGENFRVGGPGMADIERTKTILLGADVTHGSPSIAAVVATTDSNAVNYACRIKSQKPRQEQIEHLQEMVEQLLDVYHENTNEWPARIFFFRDGVSETQYLDALRFEGTAILQAAAAKYTTKPKLIIILAVKRHHTRFYKMVSGNTFGNIPGGIVVCRGVTHPREHEFYLCSQNPVIGTSRPTKYHVLLDQIGMHPDSLYRLIYSLCFSYQRCFNSVSLITPVYYAHLAAFRAKLYMECYLAENRIPPPIQGQNRGATVAAWQQRTLQEDLNAHERLRNHLWFM